MKFDGSTIYRSIHAEGCVARNQNSLTPNIAGYTQFMHRAAESKAFTLFMAASVTDEIRIGETSAPYISCTWP